MWTKSRLELMGSDVRLFCRSQGYPKPNISWLSPDGSVLVSGDKTSILEDGDLIIRDLRWEDMGGYQCLASNQDGDDKTTTFVYPMQVKFSYVVAESCSYQQFSCLNNLCLLSIHAFLSLFFTFLVSFTFPFLFQILTLPSSPLLVSFFDSLIS